MGAPSRAEQALLKLEDELYQQIDAGSGIVLHMIAKSRIESVDAMTKLVVESDPDKIRHAQNQIQRHLDLIRWLADLVKSGHDVWNTLKQREKMELLDEVFEPNEDEFVVPEFETAGDQNG